MPTTPISLATRLSQEFPSTEELRRFTRTYLEGVSPTIAEEVMNNLPGEAASKAMMAERIADALFSRGVVEGFEAALARRRAPLTGGQPATQKRWGTLALVVGIVVVVMGISWEIWFQPEPEPEPKPEPKPEPEPTTIDPNETLFLKVKVLDQITQDPLSAVSVSCDEGVKAVTQPGVGTFSIPLDTAPMTGEVHWITCRFSRYGYQKREEQFQYTRTSIRPSPDHIELIPIQ